MLHVQNLLVCVLGQLPSVGPSALGMRPIHMPDATALGSAPASTVLGGDGRGGGWGDGEIGGRGGDSGYGVYGGGDGDMGTFAWPITFADM